MQAPTLCAHTSQSQFSGARHVTRVLMVCSRMVGKTSGKVQKVSIPCQPDSRTHWCRSALPCHRLRAPRPASETYQARNVPSGRWMKVQGMFKRRAHIVSLVLVHVGVGQCCRARDGKSPSLPGRASECTSRSSRCWRKDPDKGRRRAHRGSLIRIHVGVDQRCCATNPEPPATLPTTSTRNVPTGRWNIPCLGSIRRKTHGPLPRHTTNSEHTIGAMERYTWVRFAGKLTPCHTHIWQQSAHQWGDG